MKTVDCGWHIVTQVVCQDGLVGLSEVTHGDSLMTGLRCLDDKLWQHTYKIHPQPYVGFQVDGENGRTAHPEVTHRDRPMIGSYAIG